MKSRSRLAMALAALACGACGETELHEVILRAPGSPASTEPELYLVTQAPPRPFQETALLQVIGRGDESDIADLRAALTGRGRQLGCDAVVKARFDTGYGLSQAVGVCVRWMTVTRASATAPPPAAASPPPVSPAPPRGDTSL